MCCDQLWNLTGNITTASSPSACPVPSTNALEHNYISVRVHGPREKAKLNNSFLHSKLWSHRAQFEK